MKHLILILLPMCLLISSCGGEEEANEVEENEPQIELSFEEGGAEEPNEFFDGVVAQLKNVDDKLKYVFELDDMNASEDSITDVLDQMVVLIDSAEKVLQLYDDRDWPEKDNFSDLTFDWYAAVSQLIEDYYYNLAEPMSRPDDSWTPEEKAFYEEYVEAYYAFFDIDQQWVAYQATFAEANNFELKNTEEIGL